MIFVEPSQTLDELMAAVDRLSHLDFYSHSLSSRLQLTAIEDNRVGVLNGKDGQSFTLVPTNDNYRISSGGVNIYGPHGMLRTKKVVNQKNVGRIFFFFSEIPRDHHAYAAQTNLSGQTMPVIYGGATAVGSYRSVFYNPNPVNADKSSYASLTGPPTAPNWEESRVIANYVSYDETRGPDVMISTQWENIYNDKGEFFLGKLFFGSGGTPARDLTGIRAWGLHNAEIQASYFLQDVEEGVVA